MQEARLCNEERPKGCLHTVHSNHGYCILQFLFEAMISLLQLMPRRSVSGSNDKLRCYKSLRRCASIIPLQTAWRVLCTCIFNIAPIHVNTCPFHPLQGERARRTYLLPLLTSVNKASANQGSKPHGTAG